MKPMRLAFSQATSVGASEISESNDSGDPKTLFAVVASRIFCDTSKAAAFLRQVADHLDGGQSVPVIDLPAKRRRTERSQ